MHKQVEVIGVRVEMPTNQPLVLLKELDGERILPIWIGAVEASAIAFAQQGTVTPRPLTHELLRSVLEAVGDNLDEVRIVAVHDGIFYAELVLGSGAVIDARPSDAIAVALRSGATILCDEEVLAEAAVVESEDTADEEVQVQEFREFLDTVDPEDFAS